jgi:hypothetical protein
VMVAVALQNHGSAGRVLTVRTVPKTRIAANTSGCVRRAETLSLVVSVPQSGGRAQSASLAAKKGSPDMTVGQRALHA